MIGEDHDAGALCRARPMSVERRTPNAMWREVPLRLAILQSLQETMNKSGEASVLEPQRDAHQGDSGNSPHDRVISTPWPAVEYEERAWSNSPDIPRRWQLTFSGPYRAALAPEISGLDLVLLAATMALADEATRRAGALRCRDGN